MEYKIDYRNGKLFRKYPKNQPIDNWFITGVYETFKDDRRERISLGIDPSRITHHGPYISFKY